MKYFLIAFGVFISTCTQAQFSFYAHGGGNYSMLRITRTPGIEKGHNGYGWQGGFGIEYKFQNGYFTYLGTALQSQSFKKDSATAHGFQDVVSNYSYKPLFVNIPFGFGYQFGNTKPVGLKLYAGLTTQIGVGGKLRYKSTVYKFDSTTDQAVQVKTDKNTHTLNYGRSVQVQSEFQSDLANTIWGVNVGAGLVFAKKIEVTAFYQEGLTNILPGGDGSPEVNKLRSVSLDVRFYFARHAESSK